jgi:hypothetical protein
MSRRFRFSGLLFGASVIVLVVIGALASMIAQEEMQAQRSGPAATGLCLSVQLLGVFNFAVVAVLLALSARKSASAVGRFAYWGGVAVALMLAAAITAMMKANAHVYHIAAAVLSGAIATGLASFLCIWVLWKRRKARQHGS